jgi:hypothetical protein
MTRQTCEALYVANAVEGHCSTSFNSASKSLTFGAT